MSANGKVLVAEKIGASGVALLRDSGFEVDEEVYKYQIKTRGYRVELDEVENALSSHPLVDECAVYAVPDSEGSNVIEAAVIVKKDAAATEADFKRALAERVPQYAVPASVVAQSLGRPPAGNVTNVTVNLIEPGTLYGDRFNQLDFKVQKTFKLQRVTISPQFEAFNVNNSDARISVVSNNVLNSSYGFANSVMQPLIMGVGAQVKW